MKSALYVVPNLLGAVPPREVLPQRTIDIARDITHWVVETPKAARAFLKTLEPKHAIASMQIDAISDATDARALERVLDPIRGGFAVGLLSDAGCPGVADPGAALIACAHARAISVVPLVGPSSLLLALMAAGMNGQRFAFHGYLPVKPQERANALRGLEVSSRVEQCTQIFIETPYRNAPMLATIVATLAPATRVCVAVDLTLPTESVRTLAVRDWRRVDGAVYDKRPAIFLIES
ncbi:MAG TPA: SAM-dependent methyltransferase [Casimicrobiaceae bacterium]|nr:SAM-dependent methyltransferase [Casimicrobiaceae bacterium]